MAPWLFPSAAGVLLGIGVQIAWCAGCEWFAGVTRHDAAAAPAPRAAATTPRPATTFAAAPILATVDETPDIKTIRLARPDGFDFVPGQFITVRVRVDGREHARCYSISSAPHANGYLEISVKRHGLVSNAIHAIARPGGVLLIRRPNGRFTYPSGEDRPIVLLAAGIGITPLISMLRHAVHTEPRRRVTLLYATATERDCAFGDELTGIARRNPQVRLVFARTRERSARTDVYPGRIDEQLLRAAVPDVTSSIACICGPAAMIDATRALLTRLGVPQTQIRYELFEAAVAASAATASARRGAAHEMRCALAGKTVPVEGGESLLEAAERGGVGVPSLCRAGVCGTCRIRVTAGDVDCTSTTLDDDERREGWVLACVSTPRSICTVEL